MYKLQTAEAHVRQRTLPGTDASKLSSTFAAKPNVRVDTTGLVRVSQSGRQTGSQLVRQAGGRERVRQRTRLR